MAGTLALTKAELMRLLRNKRYFIFTLAFPVVLYLLLGRQVTGNANGVAFAAYYMVAMSTFGAFSGALNGNAQRISQEKKEGWIRQLRLTPLPPNAYVVAKVLTSLATTVPSIIIVLILGRFYGNVHLPAWEWPVIAVVVWFGSTIFAALAVAIGYRFAPEQVQPVAFVVYFVFAILGGLWFPLSGVLKNIGKFTPTYQATKIATDVIQGVSVPAGLAIGLVVWLAVFIALATFAVRATAGGKSRITGQHGKEVRLRWRRDQPKRPWDRRTWLRTPC